MRRLANSIFLLCLVVISSSCSKQSPKPKNKTHRFKQSASSTKSIEIIRRTQKETLKTAESEDTGFSSPPLLLDDGTALFCSDDGWIFLLNSTSGEVINATKTANPLDGAPVVFGGHLFIGDSDGVFSSIDLSTSPLAHSLSHKERIEFADSVTHPQKNISSKQNPALDWSFKTDGKIVGRCAITTKDLGLVGAGIVFGSYDTNVYCLEALTGKLRWKLKTGNFINGSPILVNGELCIGGCDGKLRFIAPKTGNLKAIIKMGSYIPSSPAVAGSKCVVSLYTGEIVCVDALSHTAVWRWKNKKKESRLNFTTSPLISDDRVLAIFTKGNCVALSLNTGKTLWETTLSNNVETQAIVLPEIQHLAIIDNDGTLHLLNISNGEETAKFATGEPIAAPPTALGKGRFLLASENGTVTAFKTIHSQGRKPRVSRLWNLRPLSVWREKHPNPSLKP